MPKIHKMDDGRPIEFNFERAGSKGEWTDYIAYDPITKITDKIRISTEAPPIFGNELARYEIMCKIHGFREVMPFETPDSVKNMVE